MTDINPMLIATGAWGENISWELLETTTPPPVELCTAVMCVAIAKNKVVLACSERGWGMLGGHIEDGENSEQALRREAREEGGFIIDQFQLFAVRKITAKTETRHQNPSKNYPFPTSYMTYYWATTKHNLEAPSGEEIIESGCFKMGELDTLNTPDQPVIEAGWKAYTAHSSSSNNSRIS